MMPVPWALQRLFHTALAAACALLLAGSALATTPAAATAKPAPRTAAKPTTRPVVEPAPRPAPRPAARATPATTRQQADNNARGMALATATVETISAGQLDAATRVLTGAAECEFNQRITVVTLDGQPGYFTVSH